MVGRVRDSRGRYSAQPDAVTAARADRAVSIRDHVERALGLFAAPRLHWSHPDFGGINEQRTGARGVLAGTAFLALNWPGHALLLGCTREPMAEIKKRPVAALLADAERSGAITAMVASTTAAWVALEQAGAPLSRVYRPDHDPAFVAPGIIESQKGDPS